MRENEQIEFSIDEHFRAERELDEKLKPDRRYLPSGVKEAKEDKQHIFYKLKFSNGKPPHGPNRSTDQRKIAKLSSAPK